MDRRSVLSLSAITALGLALLSDNALGQQAADVDGVKAASKAFYAALAVLDNGEAMEKVWAHTPYVTYVGPRSKTIIVGWDAQKKYWEDVDKLFTQRDVTLSDQHIHVNSNMAYEIGQETGTQKMKDGSKPCTAGMSQVDGVRPARSGSSVRAGARQARRPSRKPL